MRKQKQTTTTLKGRALFLSLILLLTGASLAFAGCSNETVQEPATDNTTDLVIDIEPEPLEESQQDTDLVAYGNKGALADNDLTLAEMLAYAIQDEFAARAEYEAIINEFGSQNPYANIIRSEMTHIAYLNELYTAYALTAPADTSAEHVLVPSSLLEAAQTGVQAEIDNIAMYEKFLAQDLPDDVREVFTSLMKASESHLAAFEKQVDKLS